MGWRKWKTWEKHRAKRQKQRKRERMRRKEVKKDPPATTQLQTQSTLSPHLARFPHRNFQPSSHPVQWPSLSLCLSRPRAPLNLAHRTNGLLYASAYMKTIPFYRDSPYLLQRYLLSDRLTSSSLFLSNVHTYIHTDVLYIRKDRDTGTRTHTYTTSPDSLASNDVASTAITQPSLRE